MGLDPLQRSDGRSSAADADVEAFFAQQAAGHQVGFFVLDLNHVVPEREVVVFRQEVLADAFDFVAGRRRLRLSGFEDVINDGADRIDSDDFHRRFHFFQVLCASREGAARTDSCDENIDFGHLSENFRTCGFVMRLAIGQVVVLVEPDRIRRF